MLLRPTCAPADCATLTSHAAVAVCRALERVCGVRPGIKWTNDILLGGKKVCGILTELSLEGESGAVDSVVIGIGINANNSPEDFPEELREIAGSVYSAAGVRVCRAELAAALIMELDAMTQAWSNDPRAYLQAYRALCLTTGKEVRVLRGDTQRLAFAESVTDDFALAVRYPDGSTEALTGGEVSVRGLLGYIFQEMLIEMPFDQIKVSTLTRRCEISPNTFYYHYRDIHDLLDAWLRERVDQELDAIPKSFSWTERLRSILNICKANEKIIFHISDSNARSQLERYVYETSREHVLNAVDERLGDVHFSNARRQEIGDSFQVVFLGFFIRFLWSRMEDDIDSSVEWLDRQFWLYVRHAVGESYELRS